MTPEEIAAKEAADKEAETKRIADEKAAAAAAAAGGNAGGGNEGGTRPSDTEAALLKEVMAKKSEITKLTENLTKANENLKRFEGIDPVKVRELIAAQTKAEEAALEAKGDYERLKQRLVETHTSELQGHTSTIEKLQQELSRRDDIINGLTVGSSFDSSAFIKDELVLTPAKARVVYGGHFDVEDGRVVAYDKPRGANDRTKLIDGKGDPLPFEVALKKIVEGDPERDRLVKSKMAAGAGSNTRGGNPTPVQQELSGRDRIAAGLAARRAK